MDMVLGGIVFFLGASLLLYVLLAGADFGAGILELFMGKAHSGEQRDLISHAMAPVWEANHVWLILAVVILFMGFPPVYSMLSIYLHIPLIAILIGIVARGCAFTFRYYDTLNDDFQKIYNRVFAISSVWTSFFLGVTAGAIHLGRLQTDGTTYNDLFLDPWLNPFCFAMGTFTCALFAMLASVYLVGEARDHKVKRIFIFKSLKCSIFVIVSGALVFVFASVSGINLLKQFFSNSISFGAFALATILLYPFWKSLRESKTALFARLFGVGIVALVLFGWFTVQFPDLLRYTEQGQLMALTVSEAAAPEAVLQALLGALIVGSLLIFPALGYLLTVFKWQTFEKE